MTSNAREARGRARARNFRQPPPTELPLLESLRGSSMASSPTGVGHLNGVAHLPDARPSSGQRPRRPEWVTRGAQAGLVASAILLAGMFVTRAALGVPHLAELASDWTLLLVPRGVFDALLELLGP